MYTVERRVSLREISLKFMNRARLVRLSRWRSLSFARYEEAEARRHSAVSKAEEAGVDRGPPVGTRWSNVSYE